MSDIGHLFLASLVSDVIKSSWHIKLTDIIKTNIPVVCIVSSQGEMTWVTDIRDTVIENPHIICLLGFGEEVSDRVGTVAKPDDTITVHTVTKENRAAIDILKLDLFIILDFSICSSDCLSHSPELKDIIVISYNAGMSLKDPVRVKEDIVKNVLASGGLRQRFLGQITPHSIVDGYFASFIILSLSKAKQEA